jgi:hypothetical protein
MAICLLALTAPASAQMLELKISGTLQGTNSVIMCPPGSPLSCFSSYPGGTLTQGYTSEFTKTLFMNNLAQGDTEFRFGDLQSQGLWLGIINNSNGALTGRDLFFSFQSSGVRSLLLGSNFINASASTFAVAAVPEPATWALMLLGFGAIGSALRRAPRRALLPA